jgi:hypothetical protein
MKAKTKTSNPSQPLAAFIGIDLGNLKHHVCVIDTHGTILHECIIPLDRAALTEQIKHYENNIQQSVRAHHPQSMALQKMTFIGLITSMVFVMRIENPKRFKDPRDIVVARCCLLAATFYLFCSSSRSPATFLSSNAPGGCIRSP